MQITETDWNEQSIGTSFNDIWERYGDEIIDGDFGIIPYDQQILNKMNT